MGTEPRRSPVRACSPGRRAWPILLPLLAILGALPGPAAADPVREARRHYLAGEALLHAGQPQAALQRYARAYALVPTPLIRLGQAAAYRDLGRGRDGLAALRQIDPASLPAAEQQRYEELLADLRAMAASSGGELRTRARDGHPDLDRLLLLGPLRTPRFDPPHSSLRWGKWLAVAGSVALLATGAALWGVDGRNGCLQQMGGAGCTPQPHTATPGIVLVSVGIAGAGVSGLLFGLDARQRNYAE